MFHLVSSGLTVGIDLASGARDTAACLIDWSTSPARLVEPPVVGLGDARLIELATRPDVEKVAVDAPLGWPTSFVESVRSYTDSGRWPDLSADELRFRATEHAVRSAGGRPISAVTDKLGWTTIRCARLLSRLSETTGGLVERDGTGLVLEAYPASALLSWALPAGADGKSVSYKTAKDPSAATAERRRLLGLIEDRLDGILILAAGDLEACAASDHAFDALVCSLVARCSVLGLVEAIPEGSRWLAQREGWICVPTPDSLRALGGSG